MRRMREGEFDVIDTIFKSPERETWLASPKPHSRLEVCIFFDSEITGISDLVSARDFAVAGKTGDLSFELARKAGVSTLLAYNNYESIVAAAKVRKVHVFIMDKPPALYFLHRQNIPGPFQVSQPFHVGFFHRAVLRRNSALSSHSGGWI